MFSTVPWPRLTTRVDTVRSSLITYTKSPVAPVRSAVTGTTTAPCSVRSSRRMFTNWLGNSVPAAFWNRALARTVPVCTSIWLSSVRNTPLSSTLLRVRSRAVTGRRLSSFTDSMARAWMSGTRSWGTENCTSTGLIWVMTAIPAASPDDTTLPASTTRSPTRPLTGAVTRVKSRLSCAVFSDARSDVTVPSSCCTSAAWVSTSWRAIESCASKVW